MDRVLRDPRLAELIGLYGNAPVTDGVREVLAQRRLSAVGERLGASSAGSAQDVESVVREVAGRLERTLGTRLRPVLNATGIAVHTNLGRAPLPDEVLREMHQVLRGYSDLEYDLGRGTRADRNRRAERLLCALTGAEAAVVVNNNAAAIVLALAAFARGGEVVVSRGELVEIGGSFRIPSIVEAAGVRLVEVGTTNRTRASDFAAAMRSQTGVLLKVHTSNYRIRGFTSTVEVEALVELARETDAVVLADEGSGLLQPSARDPLRDHRSVADLVGAGCDLVCGSGDKLLGGLQAGLLVGRSRPIGVCRRHPLYRALRPGKETYAALEAVLRRQLQGTPALPLARLWSTGPELDARLEWLAGAIDGEVVEADGFIGGGSAPDAPIPGRAVVVPDRPGLAEALRGGEPAVVGYVRGSRLHLDLRTVPPEDDEDLLAAVRAALSQVGESPV